VQGMTIVQLMPSKTRDSIRVNREFDSNEIDKSDSQNEKHFEQRISPLDGRTIDLSDGYENTDDSIRVNRDLIQMKLTKVIDNLKNKMNKEFQHWMESQLIEVMNLKMQMIQFVSIVNVIQMKWMKVIYMMKNKRNKEFQHLMEV
jgi:hypothetical protein